MYEVLLFVYLVNAIALVGLIMIQQGKGSDMGSSFGAGASATLFGSSGSGNFLTKTTTTLATVFFVLSIFLGSMSANSAKSEDDWSNLAVPAKTEQAAPVEQDVPVEKKDGDVPN